MVRAIFDELGYAFVAIMERTGDPRGAALASLVSLDCEAAALGPVPRSWPRALPQGRRAAPRA